MAGRRSKYTPETVKKLTDAIRLGATYKLACAYAGITFETLNEWRKTKAGFSDQLSLAEGSATVGWLAKIEKAANEGTWQAAAWKLERRYPEEYGRVGTQRHEHGGKVSIELRTLSERAAAEYGLDPAQVMAEAERILAEVE